MRAASLAVDLASIALLFGCATIEAKSNQGLLRSGQVIKDVLGLENRNVVHDNHIGPEGKVRTSIYGYPPHTTHSNSSHPGKTTTLTSSIVITENGK
jgi:hypothetical protein